MSVFSSMENKSTERFPHWTDGRTWTYLMYREGCMLNTRILANGKGFFLIFKHNRINNKSPSFCHYVTNCTIKSQTNAYFSSRNCFHATHFVHQINNFGILLSSLLSFAIKYVNKTVITIDRMRRSSSYSNHGLFLPSVLRE